MIDENIQGALVKMQTEALDLRFGGALPDSSAGNKQIVDTLLDVRRRVDRVEEVYGKAIRLRAEARRQHTAVKAVVEDAWDRSAVAARRASVGRGDEYATARERHAMANLDVLELRRDERSAGQVVDVCDEAVEMLRLTYRGLVDLRQDFLAILRSIQFETTLDR